MFVCPFLSALWHACMHGGTILFALSLCVRTVPNPTQASKPHNTKESPSPVDKKKIQEQRGNDRRKKC